MSRTIVYSAEDLRVLLTQHSPLVQTHAAVHDLAAPLAGNAAAFVTDLSDKHNLELLLLQPLISCVLPIRATNQSEDAADRARKLDRVLVTSGPSSLIMASHDERTKIAEYSLNHSAERWKVIDAFGQFAKLAPCFSGFEEVAKTVCSELLTNAFYNAPRDREGRPLVTDRRQAVELKKPVDVVFGEDETYLWIQVRDPFGTFSRKALLRSLLKSADGEDVAVNMGEGGAGIGLYLVFRWSAQMMFTFRPHAETTVLVKLLKTKRNKIFDSQRAILELCQQD